MFCGAIEWRIGPLLACGEGCVHLVCIYVPYTFVWDPYCPFVFLGMSMHSQHSHSCIEGKVAGMQVVQRVLRAHKPLEEVMVVN